MPKPTKPKKRKHPTGQALARKFKPYAVELGYLVYSWNRLQEVFAALFWDLSLIKNPRHALAIWYAVPSDRTQREMLRALVVSSGVQIKPPAAKEDLIWMINRANSLADQRNDAVHSPFIFSVNGRSMQFQSSHRGGHPRATKLKDRELLSEFRFYADCADVLSRFGESAHRALRKVDPAWPERPSMPHREASPMGSHPQTPAKMPTLVYKFDQAKRNE